MTRGDALIKGILRDNPVAVLMLGLCPAAAVSTRVIDALWISLGVVSVLLLSSLCISLIARWTPPPDTEEPPSAQGAVMRRRRPSKTQGKCAGSRRWFGALAISSCLAACFEILLLAFAPSASASLGIYAPLIAVNCLVLTRMEVYGRGYPIGKSLVDAIGHGVGFAACIVLISLVREIFGAGTITLFPIGAFGGTLAIPALSASPARALGFAGGGLLCLGYLAGLERLLRRGDASRDASEG